MDSGQETVSVIVPTRNEQRNHQKHCEIALSDEEAPEVCHEQFLSRVKEWW